MEQRFIGFWVGWTRLMQNCLYRMPFIHKDGSYSPAHGKESMVCRKRMKVINDRVDIWGIGKAYKKMEDTTEAGVLCTW